VQDYMKSDFALQA